MSNQPFRIVGVTVHDFEKIKVVELDPVGDVVVVTGENGAGKSSFLNALIVAFTGKDAAPDIPVRRGARQSHVEIEITNDAGVTWILTDIYTKKSQHYFTLKPKGGKSIHSIL